MKPNENDRFEAFWKINYYFSGNYDLRTDFEKLNQELNNYEKAPVANRIFYLALPPSVFEKVTIHIRNACMASKWASKSINHKQKIHLQLIFRGWTRIIIEKPFGKDLHTSEQLSNHLASLFTENQIYRIDHYLGKEMVQNLMTLRFN